jgi:general secretion pathway protein E
MKMHDLIVKRESTRALARSAAKHGMRSLAESGWIKARAGETTLDEILRIISVNDR